MDVGGGMIFPASWLDGSDHTPADEARWAWEEMMEEACECDPRSPDYNERWSCSPTCPVHGDPDLIGPAL